MDKELWLKMKNDMLKSEKEIHLYRNNFNPSHPWSIMLKNILNGRAVEIWNIADSFDEGLARVQDYINEAARLGYSIEEKRTDEFLKRSASETGVPEDKPVGDRTK
jgi:hypothetical protein